MKCFAVLCLSFVIISCSSSQKQSGTSSTQNTSSQFERTLSIQVESFSKGKLDKKTFYFSKEEGESESLRMAPQYQMISRALSADGFTEVESVNQATFVPYPKVGLRSKSSRAGMP